MSQTTVVEQGNFFLATDLASRMLIGFRSGCFEQAHVTWLSGLSSALQGMGDGCLRMGKLEGSIHGASVARVLRVTD
jgi:hypothetical protein